MTANIWSLCPKPETIHPCKCDDNGIKCGGNDKLNLKQIFESMDQQLADNEKHFNGFFLNNTAITQLDDNTFYDITFDEIRIIKAEKLTSINSHAFTATNFVTKKFITDNTPLTNYPPNYDIFNSLSMISNIEHIQMERTNITEIPSYAFQPLNGFQNKLKAIYIGYGPLKKVANYAFYNLNSLVALGLYNSLIDFIPSNAFHFRKESKKPMDILISNNQLNDSSFETNAFNNIKREAALFLDGNPKITYLDEKIFAPFFDLNVNNTVELRYNYLDCNDCRSFWLKKYIGIIRDEHGYHHRVSDQCTNGKNFLDTNNFANCK